MLGFLSCQYWIGSYWCKIQKEKLFSFCKTKFIFTLSFLWLQRCIANNKIMDLNGVTYAKPQITQLGFNYGFSSPTNGILRQSIRNHLISPSYVICVIDPWYSLKESNFAITNPFFAKYNFPISVSFCL